MFYVMPTRMPLLLQEVGVNNALLFGAIMATLTMAAMPGALSCGWLRRRVGAMTVFVGSLR